MEKSKRLFIRTIVLIVLLSLVGYALYSNIFKEETKNLSVGDNAENFELKTLNSEKIELSTLKGKVVLINFWGTWCAPCKREMPVIQEVYNQHKKDGFEVLAVNLGESDIAITNFIKSKNIDFPILIDEDGTVTELYDVYQLPSSFLINRDGEIVRTFEGELDIETLKNWVTDAL